ncbi:hypothetical protein BP6252_11309 [Coleophoma cylindrospora]|uniref:Methyltransferase type 11 domain-containing protein n=1 Tax=Coleophoma cylindrospora TaxID=1849047 RepID=A0A3D8QQJ8_9HELO|nr:hypothetical protein BP6252_11309 [Coleophoma cylindrospora]
MAQNIYDTPEFFTGYSSLPRSRNGLAAMPEWPALKAMLPPLDKLRVLDLGCGFGWFARFAASEGASVLGIEISSNMLAKAASFPTEGITYKQADLETVELSGEFDLIVSVLALHYLESLERLVKQAFAVLKSGGKFVVEVEHPIYTAPSRGVFIPFEDKMVWPVDGYAREGPRTRSWFVDGVVKQHRTLETYITMFLDTGFVLERIEEWKPTKEGLEAGLCDEKEFNRPMFLLFKFGKP